MNMYSLLQRLIECSTMYPAEKTTALELITELENISSLGTTTNDTQVAEDCPCQYAMVYPENSAARVYGFVGPSSAPYKDGKMICIRCGKEKK
jgi:hypothetical protein